MSRTDTQLQQIRQLRSEGRYPEALSGAREMATMLAREAGSPAWQRADAARLVATLARIAGLPDSARRALAGADRADAVIPDLLVQGLYRRGAALARNQLAVRRNLLGEEAPDVAVSLSAVGDFDLVQGDLLEARDFYSRALDLRRNILGEKHPDVAQSLEKLGLAEQHLGYDENAKTRYQQSYELRRELFGDAHPCVAASMNRQADLLRRELRVDESIPLFRSALKILQSTLGPDSPEAADVLCNLGLAHYWKEDYKDAERCLRRAVDLGRRAHGVSRETRALSCSLYGLVLSKEGRYRQAEPVQRESAQIYELLRRQGKPGAPPGHPLLIYSQLALTQLERGEQDAAWNSMERSLSRSLLDGVSPPPTDSVTAAQGFIGASDDGRFCSLKRVQSHLADHTALIGWLAPWRGLRAITDYPIWGYVIRRHGPVHWARIGSPPIPGGSAGTLAASVLSEALGKEAAWPVRVPADPDLNAKAEKVYREFMLPLQPFLDGATRLVIVRGLIGVDTPCELLVGPDGAFMGERYEISYTPSSALYVWMREHARPPKPPRSWQVLAIGDPESGFEPEVQVPAADLTWSRAGLLRSLAARSQADLPGAPASWKKTAEGDLEPLPGSRREVQRVAAIFPTATVLIGRDASKRNLARLAESRRLLDFDLIHLALHGHVDAYDTHTALVLARRMGQQDRPECGSSAADDDRLGVQEMLSTWKLNADLVTLSACRLGHAFRPSEPLQGIEEAVLRAGAHSLLVSCWDVDDAATALLMERFYQDLTGAYQDERMGRFGEAMSKSLALHEASNWLREYRDAQGRQPFANPIYWAAFTLVGDAGE